MNRREIDVIENAVTVADVLRLHGIKVKGNRCKCPIHNGEHYNFSFTDKLYHCFQCGAGGGVIQLEAELSDVSEDQACRLLADAFGLDISKKPVTREMLLNRMIDKDYKVYESEKKEYYNRLATLYRNLPDAPELAELKSSLEDWLDENINGVKQEWKYLSIQNVIS